MFAAIKNLIPEPRQADQPGNYTRPHRTPEAVPADRRGVRESIVGRMERHGGHAHGRSTPGEGTEVELTL